MEAVVVDMRVKGGGEKRACGHGKGNGDAACCGGALWISSSLMG